VLDSTLDPQFWRVRAPSRAASNPLSPRTRSPTGQMLRTPGSSFRIKLRVLRRLSLRPSTRGGPAVLRLSLLPSPLLRPPPPHPPCRLRRPPSPRHRHAARLGAPSPPASQNPTVFPEVRPLGPTDEDGRLCLPQREVEQPGGGRYVELSSATWNSSAGRELWLPNSCTGDRRSTKIIPHPISSSASPGLGSRARPASPSGGASSARSLSHRHAPARGCAPVPASTLWWPGRPTLMRG
jgi:hypothetical protein